MSPDPVAEPPRPQNQPNGPLKFTVATVTYNAASHIERTIRSIEQQDYPHVEHVVIDGNSQDQTFTLLQHYLERNSVADQRHELIVRSEPDNGIYDAMNKALQLATGHYILYINAGDTLHSPHILSQLAALAGNDPQRRPAVLYGHTDIVDNEGRFIRKRRLAPPRRLTWRSFRSGMVVCHQSFAARTDIARQFPYDDGHYRYSADFDWCIRIMRQAARQSLPLTPLLEQDGQIGTVADFLDTEGGTTHQHHNASLRERFSIMRQHYGWLQTAILHAWFVIRAAVKK